MKKFLVAAAFSVAFASVAVAQTSYPIPPRDPPFGKGGLDNRTERESANSASDAGIPPRDPPFGKGELSDDPAPPPNPAATGSNGEIEKSTKSRAAKNKTAMKKDPGGTKSGTKQDAAPKNDTD